jgi:hypothetical protein
MTFQLIRKDGKIRGIALLVGGDKVLSGRTERHEYWRICDHCTVREALVFCRTHNQYVCNNCLDWHGRLSCGGDFIFGYACVLMSMAVAREVQKAALLRVEVEA